MKETEMKKLNVELKGVSVDLVCKTFGLEKEEFNKGSGVYCITTGCRNVVESVEFSDEYFSVEEIIEDDSKGIDDEEELEGIKSYFDEFYNENGLYVENGIEVFGVSYDEENGVEFVNVIV